MPSGKDKRERSSKKGSSSSSSSSSRNLDKGSSDGKKEVKDAAPPPKAAAPSSSAAAAAAAAGGEDEGEVAALDAASGAAGDVYATLPAEVFSAFASLQKFARQLNTALPVPEFVLVGPVGAGKTSLLEAFLGEQLGSGETPTTRPVHLNVINNPACSEPKVTVKRDVVSKVAEKSVALSELGAELASRSSTASETPIVVSYEFKDTCNMTLIDTPGLTSDNEALVERLARPSHRVVLAVENAGEWSETTAVDFVKKIDPELSRTVFVSTNFHSHLQSFTSTRDVNKYLSGALPDVKTFFVSVPSAAVRASCADGDAFRTRVAQVAARDMADLEQLQYDTRHEKALGLGALRKHILAVAWKAYQDGVPMILKELRQQKARKEAERVAIEAELASLDSGKLRSVSSSYVVEFLQVIESLIEGTSQGNPAVNGQTLDEEKEAHGEGDWVDIYNRVIEFDAEACGIPYHENKVYGGQQFERLLHEFKSVADSTKMIDVTMNDVATAAGINKLNNVPNFGWAAADLAQQKSQEAFLPLIEQLTSRMTFVIKRLTDIADKIIDARRKGDSGAAGAGAGAGAAGGVGDVSEFPYFKFMVKDTYFKFVDAVAKSCREKFLDEFYSTRTIYWDLTESGELGDVPLDRSDSEQTEGKVKQLSEKVFDNLRARISTNILLKAYNFFLVPMQTQLGTELQSKVHSLSDDQLQDFFKVATTTERLQAALEAVKADLAAADSQQADFSAQAAAFAHPAGQ